MPKLKSITSFRLQASGFKLHVSCFRTNGFTLIELILYVALVGILLTAAAIFATDVVLGSIKGRVRAQVQSEARFALEKMRQEIVKTKDILSSVWVISSSDDILQKFDAATGQQIGGNISTDNAPHYLAYDGMQNAIWLDTDSNTLQKFNAVTSAVIGSTNVGPAAIIGDIVYDSIQNVVWVSAGSNLQKINAATGQKLGVDLNVGTGIYAIAYDSTQNAVWVTTGSNVLKKIDAKSGSQIGGDINTDSNPLYAAYDITQKAVWIATNPVAGSKTLQKFDAYTSAPIGTWNISGAPNGLVYDVRQNAIWVATTPNLIQKFNAIDGAWISDINLASTPQISYDRIQNVIWVIYSGLNILQKYDAATGVKIGADITTVPAFDVISSDDCRFKYADDTTYLTLAINGNGSSDNMLQSCKKSGSSCINTDNWTNLTSPEVEVTNFACPNISSGTSLGEEAVKIQMTLKKKNPGGKKEFDAEVTVETSIALRL